MLRKVAQGIAVVSALGSQVVLVSSSDLPYSLQIADNFTAQQKQEVKVAIDALVQTDDPIVHRTNVQNIVRTAVQHIIDLFDSGRGRDPEFVGDGVDVYIVNTEVRAALQNKLRPSVGDVLGNLDAWFEVVDSAWDTQDVLESFADRSEFQEFVGALVQGPGGSISPERFLELLDEFVKTFMYWWFQLHFLDDGEGGQGDASEDIPDVGGYTWEDLQSRVIRNRAGSHWESMYVGPLTDTLGGGYDGYDIAGQLHGRVVTNWPYAANIPVNPTTLLLRAANDPDIDNKIKTHVMNSRSVRLLWEPPGSAVVYDGNAPVRTKLENFQTHIRIANYDEFVKLGDFAEQINACKISEVLADVKGEAAKVNLNTRLHSKVTTTLKDINDNAPSFLAVRAHNDSVRAITRNAFPLIIRAYVGCSLANQGCDDGYPLLIPPMDPFARSQTTVPRRNRADYITQFDSGNITLGDFAEPISENQISGVSTVSDEIAGINDNAHSGDETPSKSPEQGSNEFDIDDLVAKFDYMMDAIESDFVT